MPDSDTGRPRSHCHSFLIVRDDPHDIGLLAELLERLGTAECLQWRLRRESVPRCSPRPRVLSAHHLALVPELTRSAQPGSPASPAEAAVRSSSDVMREHLLATLEQTGWNISHVATALGLSRNTVRARVARYGIQKPEGAAAEESGPALPPPDPPQREQRRSVPTLSGGWQPSHLALLLVRLKISGDEDLVLAQSAINVHGLTIRSPRPISRSRR